MPRRAAQRVSGAIDEPNVILPLAFSYNERGVQGYTHTVTNSEDQRKINVFYEIVKNAATGKGTLTLSKRPGVTDSGKQYGDSGQTAYLIQNFTGVTASELNVLFNKSGSNSRGSVTFPSGTTILNDATYFPAYSDLTAISNVLTVTVQLVKDGFTQKTYFLDAPSIVGGSPWTQITDADFIGYSHVGKMEHLDGFAFILTTTNLIINSDTNSLANWTATSFLAKQIRQDTAVGLARLSNKLLAFGIETAEVFYNAGNTTGSPLGRIPQLHSRVGLNKTISPSGTHYYCIVNSKLYFIGKAARGTSCGLYVFDGSSFIQVSSPYINKILTEKSATTYSVNSVMFNNQTMVAIGFTSPGTSPQISLLYSPEWNEWFEWTSTVFSTVNQGELFLGLGSNQQKTYSFPSSDNWQDDGTSYAWSTQFKLPTNGSSTKFMPMYGIDADTDTSTNDLTVEISTIDPQVFSTLGTIDQTQDRKVLFEGGSFTKAWIRLGNTNARPTRIHNFLARLE